MAMSWIGLEEDGAPARATAQAETITDWLVRLRVEGRRVDVRISAASEREAHRWARRLGGDYTLTRA